MIELPIFSLVRPHLEYAISSWCPYFEKDVNALEKVQRRASKLVHELRHLDYSERLSKLKLTDLKTRRVRGDLIQMFKIVNGIEIVNFTNGINYSSNTKIDNRRYELRRHRQNLTRELVRSCVPRFNFFINRVVNDWNKLPEEIINSRNTNSFKAKLDVWMAKRFEATAIAH